MINPNIQDAVNAQIKAELESAYLYLSPAAYFHNADLSGFAHWMRIQSQEELIHAMKFYDFMLERGGSDILLLWNQPETKFGSAEGIFDKSHKHKQVEKEANASRILEMIKMVENKPYSLLAFDHRMGKRGSD